MLFNPTYKYVKLKDLPIVSDELHVVSLMTLLNAVHTDGIAVCCVTGVTPLERTEMNKNLRQTQEHS